MQAVHWLPPHDGYPMGRPCPPILTEQEAMILLRVTSKSGMVEYIRDGLKYDRRYRARVYRLEDVLAYQKTRSGVVG